MPYTEPDTETLLTELQEVLESNGKIPAEHRVRIQLKLIGEIYRLVKPLPEKVAHLERRNLLMLAEKHPLAAAFGVALFFFVLELWHSAVWRPWLYALLGIETP